VTDTTTPRPEAEIAGRLETARKRLPRDGEFMKSFVADYLSLKRTDPAIILERMRKIRSITGGEEDAKPAAKKARKTRAKTNKATINRHIDIALARGLPVTGILPDGTVLTAGSATAVANESDWDDVR
jgi:hypothetical protein